MVIFKSLVRLRRAYENKRRYWVFINLICALLFIPIILLFENNELYFEISALMFLLVLSLVGVDISMAITYREAAKIFGALLALPWVGLLWIMATDERSPLRIFREDFFGVLLVTVFLAGAILFVWGLPAAILTARDKRRPRTFWRDEVSDSDGYDAGYFVFRKLPEDIAGKTTLGEIQDLLWKHNPIFDDQAKNTDAAVAFYLDRRSPESSLTERDILKIIELRDTFKKLEHIELPIGYGQESNN